MSLSKILPAAGRVYEYWHVVNKLFSGVPRSMMCTLPASAVSSMRMHGTKSAAVSISRWPNAFRYSFHHQDSYTGSGISCRREDFNALIFEISRATSFH